MRTAFADLLKAPGPAFLYVRIDAGNAEGVPKLLVDPVSIGHRFTTWLADRLARADGGIPPGRA
jgi:hypothetical protein